MESTHRTRLREVSVREVKGQARDLKSDLEARYHKRLQVGELLLRGTTYGKRGRSRKCSMELFLSRWPGIVIEFLSVQSSACVFVLFRKSKFWSFPTNPSLVLSSGARGRVHATGSVSSTRWSLVVAYLVAFRTLSPTRSFACQCMRHTGVVP